MMHVAMRLVGSAVLGLLFCGLARGAEEEVELNPIGEWDALAKDIVPRYVRKNVGMGAALRQVRRARCTGHVTLSTSHNPGPFTGKIKYDLHDVNEDGQIAANEVEAEPLGTSNIFLTGALGKLCRDLKSMTIASMSETKLFEFCDIETQKTPTGYRLKLEPAERRVRTVLGFLEGVLTITKDLRATELRLSGVGAAGLPGAGAGRSEVRMTFKHRRFGDKWLAAGFTKTTQTFGTTTVDDVAFDYGEIEGMQLLTRMVCVTTIRAQGLPTVPPMPTGRGQTIRVDVKFTDWKIKKR